MHTHCGVELLGGIGCSVDDFGNKDADKQPATADEAVEKFDSNSLTGELLSAETGRNKGESGRNIGPLWSQMSPEFGRNVLYCSQTSRKSEQLLGAPNMECHPSIADGSLFELYGIHKKMFAWCRSSLHHDLVQITTFFRPNHFSSQESFHVT